MRLVGRISDWNDDKGYGFVTPHDGGARAFVHVKAFQFGSRRPIDGDLISYDVAKDTKGRANAVNARFAGQRIEKRSAPRRIPRRVLGVLALLAVIAAAALQWVPVVVSLVYLLLSGARTSCTGGTRMRPGPRRNARRRTRCTCWTCSVAGRAR